MLAFVGYQLIEIAVKNNRIDKITLENERLEQQLDENTKDAEYYESVFGKEWLAFQNGFVRP